VRAGVATETQHGAVIPPIYLSSTYSFAGFKEKRTYDYTRTANPTRTPWAPPWPSWRRAPERW